MSWTSRAWLVAGSIGAVEALKDQGFCRWNYAFREIQQHVKANVKRPYTTQTKKLSSAATLSNPNYKKKREEQSKQSEESLRKVMYLSCWGPN